MRRYRPSIKRRLDLAVRVMGSGDIPSYLPLAADEREGDEWLTVGAVNQGADWRAQEWTANPPKEAVL